MDELAEIMKTVDHPYVDDNPATVYKELKDGERLILGAVQGLFTAVADETTKHDAYENVKNTTLKELFDEEAAGTAKKRTELQRQAIYRLKHMKERLAWQLAKRDAEAMKSYIEGLLGIQTSIEARGKLIALDERFAGKNYT